MIYSTPQFRQTVAHRFAAIGSSFEILPEQQMYTPLEFLALTILDDVNGEPIEVMAALSELIDPTCKRVAMDAAGNPPYYTGGLALNDVMGGCSECGYPFGGSYHNLGNLFNAPNYCPNCGARVVNSDDAD
ncbi:hypothetical protein [Atopobium fossor]|uniref:hypothetical protein n=1 Tax=Atopobium fossor TaxID=39487 RepID=UPI000485ECA7|nr:hypothetical protein [Atopobium fossor]